MIKESGLIFSEIEPEAVDMPFGTMTGAGVIFGVSGGVTEAVLRRVSTDKSPGALRSIAMAGVRGNEDIKELTASYGDRELKIAIVNGLKGAEEIISRIRQGEHFDFVEVMACHGACVSGAGQPYIVNEGKRAPGQGSLRFG